MKTIHLLLLAGFALFFATAGCDKCPDVKIPKNLSPIDWEEYNDVYTVYWNGQKKGWALNGKTVKITGWLYNPDHVEVTATVISDYFRLAGRPNDGYYSKKVQLAPGSVDIIEPLTIKLANSDLTKKCYITGIIWIETITIDCFPIVTCVAITDIDNIYFE